MIATPLTERTQRPAQVPPSGHAAIGAEAVLLSLPRPIAVVGNATPARAFGSLIDGYASVIRLNNYTLQGFEAQVGRRTTLRATSGWTDIQPRGELPELSPFRRDSQQSSNLARHEAASGLRVATPQADLEELLPGVDLPSTGLALLALCSQLGIPVDAFCFDGFRSGHYWDGGGSRSVHSENEREALLALPGVTLFGPSYDYAKLYDFCHDQHAGYDQNEGLRVFGQLDIGLSGERILEFGAGNGHLAAHLERAGNEVTAVEVSRVAFERIPVARKLHGDALDLALLAAPHGDGFDRFLSMDVLEHLTENDIRIVLRQAARLCRGILVSVSTRPSGLLGPNGENLHLTVRPLHWWMALIGEHFDVQPIIGLELGQVLFEGARRTAGAAPMTSATRDTLALPPRLHNLGLPASYRARPAPVYYVDSVQNNLGVTWQPDVYPAAADIARSLGCDTLVDVGCGHARKLVALAGEFQIVGIDFGPNIEHCRSQYRVGNWLEADLERALPLPVPRSMLRRSVVICSDVIEHLCDPMPLLALMKDLLQDAAAVVLSTPDRSRTYGPTHQGPSPNPAHTREWDLEELGALLRHAGFELALLTHTRSNDARPQQATIMTVMVNRQHPGLQEQASPQEPPVAAPTARAAPAATVPATPMAMPMPMPMPMQLQIPAAPASADAWVARAHQFEQDGQVESFESAMAQAFALDPEHAGATRLLADLYLREGQPADAAPLFDRLLERGDRDPATLEGAVLAHLRSGNPKSAAIRLIQVS